MWKKRREAVLELVDTEENFLKDLLVIKQVFADPTSPRGGPLQYLLAAQDHASLFSNVDDLVISSTVSYIYINIKSLLNDS